MTNTPRTKQLFLHERILQDIKEHIMSGQWPPGHAVPFETELAKTYNCSRMTVNKALTQLARNGLIERRRRAGSRVAQPRTESAVMEIRPVESEVRSLGHDYAYQQLSRTTASSAVCGQKGHFASAVPLLLLRGLHLAAGYPFCLEYRVINLQAVPDAAEVDFSSRPPGPWLLEHVPWSAATHVIRAEQPDVDVCVVLQLEKGTPCLVIERETVDTSSFTITQVRFDYPGTHHAVRAYFTPADSASMCSL